MEKNSKAKELKKTTVSAKGAIELAEITYRQITDWDSKNILPMEKGGNLKWHKFSGEDIIRLIIMKSFLDLGIPIQKLRKLFTWLNKPHGIEFLVTKVYYGFNVYLLTDLSENFVFYSETELKETTSMRKWNIEILLPLSEKVVEIIKKLGKKQ